MRGHRDLRTVVVAAVLCAVMALVLPSEAISLVFAAPLAFFLPGYALTAAFFARRPIEWPQFLLLSLGLSLSVLALGGLILNYLPGGVAPVPWALLLLIVVLNGCRATALRRPRSAEAGPRWPRLRVNRAGAGLLLGALLATVAALALTFTTMSAKSALGYTELWLLPPTSSDSQAGGARVGITSQEQSPTAYRLAVRVGDRREEIVRLLSLDPGETRVLKLSPSLSVPPGATIPVAATLFLQSDLADPYRRVSGRMTGPEPSR